MPAAPSPLTAGADSPLSLLAGVGPALREKLAALHPYEVPELIALAIVDGAPAYLQWLAAETAP